MIESQMPVSNSINGGGVLLSVIVPVFNAQGYIKECVDSLLRQGIPEAELQLILIDDGSTDGSGAIVDALVADHECFQVIHKPNGGVSSARNIGLDNAVGRYLAFVDVDDTVADGSFGLICSWLEETGASNARYQYVTDIDKAQPPASFELCSYAGSPNVCTFIFRRDLVKDVRFIEELSYGEDTCFAYECSLHLRGSRQLVVDGSPYFYRDNPTSSMHNVDYDVHAHDMLLIADRYKKLIPVAVDAGVGKEAEMRISYAVSAYLFDKLRMRKSFELDVLKGKGLIPCVLPWALLSTRGANVSLKGRFANYLRFCLLLRPVAWTVDKAFCR